MATTYYKVLNRRGCGPIEGRLRYSLPASRVFGDPKPGMWHTVVGDLRMCSNGLHIVTAANIEHWLGTRSPASRFRGRRLFVVELPKGVERRRDKLKHCVRTLRLVREIKRGSPEWIALGLAC